MIAGANYSTPVTVNGFLCKNCTDVDYAKKHIDPAHPKSGPYGINAKDDPTAQKPAMSAAVIFGGNLSALSGARALTGGDSAAVPGNVIAGPASIAVGAQLDISA